MTLEKVLGITAVGNSALACDPRSGLVAYPAGWEETVRTSVNVVEWSDSSARCASAAALSSPPVMHALCAKLVCAWVSVILAAQSVSSRRSGVCFHHRKLFFLSPWGVSFETLCKTLLWWLLHSLIHSAQTVTLSLSVLIRRGTAAAPLASLGARRKTSAQALSDYGYNLSQSCMLRDDRLWGLCSFHLFCFYQRHRCRRCCAHMQECACYMSFRLALCVPPLVLFSLANHLLPQFKSMQAVVPGADPVFLARR